MEQIFSQLFYEVEKHRDTVLVTLIADRGSAPRKAGAQMLVGAEGRLVGTIGGGAVGCAVARELSRWQVKICLAEQGEDVCVGTSKANSAIVHAGFDAPAGSMKARFNVEGSRRMEALSRELTRLTVTANLKMREIGFKPYVAPALSSGALSLLLCLRGQWHCSSTYLDGVFMGARNRVLPTGTELERLPLPQALRDRLQTTMDRLRAID